jgi:hypothetical protein
MKPTAQPPIALTEVWLPSLNPNHRPTLIVRSNDALIAKIPVPHSPSPAVWRQLTGALETFHPASAGCQEITHREIYHNPTNHCALLVFWIPEDAPSVPHYAAAVKRTEAKILRTRALKPLGVPQISANYNPVPLEQTVEVVTDGALKKRRGERLRLRNARQAISHVFPGLIKIVLDKSAGTIKTSFEGCSVPKVIKHRELYARALRKFGFDTINPETDFKLGTWRVKTDGPKKKFYHVLTFYTQPTPKANPSTIRVDFTPTWARKIQPKTDEEIDRELSELLSNRDSLIKRLKIKTTTRK